jgi:hypothetical protein
MRRARLRFFLGAGPITDALEGTLLNIANVIP